MANALSNHIVKKRRVVGGLPAKNSKVILPNGLDMSRDGNGALLFVISSRPDKHPSYKSLRDRAFCMDSLIECVPFSEERSLMYLKVFLQDVLGDYLEGLNDHTNPYSSYGNTSAGVMEG